MMKVKFTAYAVDLVRELNNCRSLKRRTGNLLIYSDLLRLAADIIVVEKYIFSKT
jgi:hypothetical protein